MLIGVYRHISPLDYLSEERISAYLKTAEEMSFELFFFEDTSVDIENAYIIGKDKY